MHIYVSDGCGEEKNTSHRRACRGMHAGAKRLYLKSGKDNLALLLLDNEVLLFYFYFCLFLLLLLVALCTKCLISTMSLVRVRWWTGPLISYATNMRAIPQVVM